MDDLLGAFQQTVTLSSSSSNAFKVPSSTSKPTPSKSTPSDTVPETMDVRMWVDAKLSASKHVSTDDRAAEMKQNAQSPISMDARVAKVPQYQYQYRFAHRKLRSANVDRMIESNNQTMSEAPESSGVGGDKPLIDFDMEEVCLDVTSHQHCLQSVDAHQQMQTLEDQTRCLQSEKAHIEKDNIKLHHEIDALQASLQKANLELETKTQAVERSLFEARQAISLKPFVLILIDGNDLKLSPQYFSNGFEGGVQAAQELAEGVTNHLSHHYDLSDWAMLAQIYVDFDELSAAADLKHTTIRKFGEGFSKYQPCFTLLDTGSSSQTQSRIQTMFDTFISNCHCKHIVLGCNNDIGYTKMLELPAQNPIMASSITLIEASETTLLYQRSSFDKIPLASLSSCENFRGNATELALGNGEVIDLAIGSARSSKTSDDSLSAPQHSSQTSHLTDPLKPVTKGAPYQVSTSYQLPSGWDSALDKVRLNINGQRVDVALPSIDPEIDAQMTTMNRTQHFCRFYHLLGFCGNNGCRYRHGEQLNETQKVKLRQWNRRLKCTNGLQCRNPHCSLGHTCPDLPQCKSKNCVFSESHYVDLHVVKILPV